MLPLDYLVKKCLSRPELVSPATMGGMVGVIHSPDVVTHKALDVFLASVMDADMVTAVKDIESVEVSRIRLFNIELHGIFVLKYCFRVALVKFFLKFGSLHQVSAISVVCILFVILTLLLAKLLLVVI